MRKIEGVQNMRHVSFRYLVHIFWDNVYRMWFKGFCCKSNHITVASLPDICIRSKWMDSINLTLWCITIKWQMGGGETCIYFKTRRYGFPIGKENVLGNFFFPQSVKMSKNFFFKSAFLGFRWTEMRLLIVKSFSRDPWDRHGNQSVIIWEAFDLSTCKILHLCGT